MPASAPTTAPADDPALLVVGGLFLSKYALPFLFRAVAKVPELVLVSALAWCFFLAGVARSVAAANVTINFVLPGTFETDRFRSNIESTAKKKSISYDAAFAERVGTVPAKRIGQPDELGATCAFLCSAQAGYITGQNILIDGGAFPGAF